MAPVTTAAILLRAHDYGDSSRILRFYTLEHGLLSVVARGVRDRMGKGAQTLTTFASGELSAYVKPQRDLHTMKDFVCTRMRDGIAADMLRFAGAAAAAELVLVHAEQEPHAELFEALETTVERLAGVDSELRPAAALAGLWRITEAFGFAPQVDVCVSCGEVLGADEVGRFDLAAGGVRCEKCGVEILGPRIGPRARGQVRLLADGVLPDGLTHARQHLALVSDFVAYHVVSRPLKSLRFLSDLLPDDAGTAP